MWFQVEYEEGPTFAFSFSDSAIQKYQPLLQSSICFGVAVKILGEYEAYVRKMVLHAGATRKTNLDNFKKKYRTQDVLKVGRGLNFFEEVLGCQMPPDGCKPILNFSFELRNVAVHNLSRADKKLCTAAQSEYIKGDPINEGDLVKWKINDLNQLHGLMLGLIPIIDQSASSVLGLSQITKVLPWYYGNGNAVSEFISRSNFVDRFSNFKHVFGLSTTTMTIGDQAISVSNVGQMSIQGTAGEGRQVRVASEPLFFTYKGLSEDGAKRHALKRLIEFITTHPEYNEKDRVAIITNYDIGNHKSYNSGELPIYREFYLPMNVEVVFATDSFASEVMSTLIDHCNQQVQLVLKTLEINGSVNIGDRNIGIDNIPTGQ